MDSLVSLAAEIADCRRCDRLVEWREQVASEKRAAFRDQDYWGRGVPGFGDPAAKVMIVGVAPAAHGANRTGRVFTGDRSGDFLFASLHRTGFANQSFARHVGDGLQLADAYVTAAVRCAPPANKPTTEERDPLSNVNWNCFLKLRFLWRWDSLATKQRVQFSECVLDPGSATEL